MKRSVKKSMLAGLATLSVVALSACGASSSASPAAGGKPGLTKINVGVIPIVDTAPIWLGKKKGFFAAEGLDITIEPTTGGAASAVSYTHLTLPTILRV